MRGVSHIHIIYTRKTYIALFPTLPTRTHPHTAADNVLPTRLRLEPIHTLLYSLPRTANQPSTPCRSPYTHTYIATYPLYTTPSPCHRHASGNLPPLGNRYMSLARVCVCVCLWGWIARDAHNAHSTGAVHNTRTQTKAHV